ncbi:MHS family MFS transporter [Streptomyces bathyalis]|uniref:Putative proline/betaine transporter n=1 Tax=Streptomyces bathyalis TaxID=2710756 RepID=A0A7T1TBZ6_9ACTN|nr:MFS transporter [Streptomyces bathyalis]QPP10206.1 MHS family MFS transporter [Streptomyces bathyalis]
MAHTTQGHDTPDDPAAVHRPREAVSRKAVIAGAIGNFVEWYDFVLYGAAAPILARVFFPGGDPQAAIMATFATFGVAFVARPFGAFILGNLGDRAGRRNVLAGVVLAMSIGTAVIALLPGYAQIGVWAPLLLLLLRALQGFAAGGEFGGSATFIVEYAPPGKRGRYGSWQTATVGLGSATATATVLLFTSILPESELDAWGWRIPFALALPLGVIGLYMRMKLEDTPDYKHVAERREELKSRPSVPVLEALRHHWKLILLGAAVVTGGTVSTYVFHNYIPAYLNSERGVPLSVALGGNLIGLLVYSGAALMWGRLSDRTGRKPILITGAVALLALIYPIFELDNAVNLAAIAAGQALFGICAAAIMGLVPTLLSEFFPTTVRMSALSVTYTLANALFGGTAPFVVAWLVGVTDTPNIVVVYCVAALLFTLAGALAIRETARRPMPDV